MVTDDGKTPPLPPRVRAHVDEAQRIVRIVLPPFSELTDEEARAAIEEAIRIRRTWEAMGYSTRQ